MVPDYNIFIAQACFFKDRTEVIASAYGLTVTPDGQVYGWSTYPAEPLDCSGI